MFILKNIIFELFKKKKKKTEKTTCDLLGTSEYQLISNPRIVINH